jgi:hypothetical protein
MSDCDEFASRLFLGAPLEPEATAHLAACPRCAGEAPQLEALARRLAADRAPEPPLALGSRILRAAEPLLAAQAERTRRRALAAALAVALLPLPFLVLLEVHIVRSAYHLLTGILPGPVSLYLVCNWTATLLLLLALTYGAIPILVEQQVRSRRLEAHGRA